jgi:hypothetical protein
VERCGFVAVTAPLCEQGGARQIAPLRIELDRADDVAIRARAIAVRKRDARAMVIGRCERPRRVVV